MNSKIIAVVVTYNRLELLKKVLFALRRQTYKIEKIIVVNNSSTDGTLEWLMQNNERLEIITQENTGSSGGQYTGFKLALEYDCDAIWVMDDDVVAEIDCLENLLKYYDNNSVLLPLRYNNNGTPYINDTLKLNMTNPFKSIWKKIISESDLKLDKIKVEGPTFEGPLFPKKVMQKAGLPEKKFFIYGDDTEYFQRILKLNISSFIIPNAKMRRMIDPPKNMFEFNWKTFYFIRNIIAIDILHAPFFVRLIRPFGYLLSWLSKCKNISEIKTTINAFVEGYFYKSEN